MHISGFVPMRDTPEVFLTTLHDIAVYSGESDDEQHTGPEHSGSWASVLSSASVLQGSPYTNLVNQLFMTPFKSHDAFRIQQLMADKLSHDMSNIKEYVLPYAKAKDGDHHTLNSVSMEVDEVERFLETNTEHTSRFYDWKQVLMRLERDGSVSRKSSDGSNSHSARRRCTRELVGGGRGPGFIPRRRAIYT